MTGTRYFVFFSKSFFALTFFHTHFFLRQTESSPAKAFALTLCEKLDFVKQSTKNIMSEMTELINIINIKLDKNIEK